mmetsp:Transcript_66534/g.178042  ORF Transcript_66534/g.178042 Transcript_66534/m.178042 type:complete len:128 (+) Transcript_66534:263-646(+)
MQAPTPPNLQSTDGWEVLDGSDAATLACAQQWNGSAGVSLGRNSPVQQNWLNPDLEPEEPPTQHSRILSQTSSLPPPTRFVKRANQSENSRIQEYRNQEEGGDETPAESSIRRVLSNDALMLFVFSS